MGDYLVEARAYSYWQIPVKDKDLVTNPGGESKGDRYIIAGTGGDWSGGTINDIAQYTGAAWIFYTPIEGWMVYVIDEDIWYFFDGSNWKKQIDDFTIKHSSGQLKIADRIEQNIVLNAFRIAINGSLVKYNMIDGIVDEFEDESGVNIGLSVNEDYDSTNDLYEPLVTAALELDYMEYATDGAAQAAYVTSASPGLPSSEYSSDSDTKLLLNCNGADESTTIPDSGNTNHGNATVVGTAQLDTAQKVFGTASLLLDGNSDYIYFDDHDDWDFGSGDFTVDFRVRFNNATKLTGFVGRFIASPNYGWNIIHEDDELRVSYSTTGSDASTKIFPWSPSTATWYHVAVVRNGNDLMVFIDGIQIGSTETLDVTIYDNDYRLEIGSYFGDVGRALDGWMDEVRVSKGIARWTSDFGVCAVQSYSEDTIINQGTYSLKADAVITDSLNETLTKSGLSIDLSGVNTLKYDIYSEDRTGSHIKIGIHDSGGTTTEHTANISSTEAWEEQTIDLSGVADGNKDDIDSIIITVVNADAANTFYIDNFYAPGVTNDMTLISEEFTAEAQPGNSRLVLFEEDVDAITENTDLKAYVSRDGRTTYSQVTLSDEGDYGSGKRILTGIVDISGQPAGTTMVWKVTTHNAKKLKLHGIGVLWD